MADNFTVDVRFGNQKTTSIQPLFQYDRGIKLRLIDYNNTFLPQAQFAFAGIKQTVNGAVNKESSGTYYVIEIPDIILYQPKPVRCFLYLETMEEGRTIYEICIPIIPRQRPADGTYTDSEIAAFDALMVELNSTKDKVEALTEVCFAGSGLLYVGLGENHELIIDKAMLDDETDAYRIAVLNGYQGTREQWDAFVEDLLSHATPDQAQAAAEQASQDAANAVSEVQTDLEEYKTTAELYTLTKANEVASRSAKVDILSTDWTAVSGEDNMYTCTKSCSIATEYNNLLVGVDGPLTAAQFSDVAAATIVATSQANGYVTFTAYGDKPLNTLTFNVIAFLDGTSSQSQQQLQNYSFEININDGCLYLNIS